MSRDLEGAVMLVVGTVLARITLEGSYLAYVKSNLFWPLLVTSAVLLFLGFTTLRRQPIADVQAVARIAPEDVATAASPEAGDGPDGRLDAEPDVDTELVADEATSVGQPHGHHKPPRMGVLLLAPVLVLVLMAPPPLGAFAADRGNVNSIAEDFATDLPPLPPSDGPVELTISEFVLRTLAEGDASVRDVPVRLTGFVAGAQSDSFLLSRFAIACCAADASPRQVRMLGEPSPVAEDQWIEATVVWDGNARGGDEQRVPDVMVIEVTAIDTPSVPYEYAAY